MLTYILLSVFSIPLWRWKYPRIKLFHNRLHFIKKSQIGTTNTKLSWVYYFARSYINTQQFRKRHINIIELANCVVHVRCGFLSACLRTPRETSGFLEINMETHFSDIPVLYILDDLSLLSVFGSAMYSVKLEVMINCIT